MEYGIEEDDQKQKILSSVEQFILYLKKVINEETLSELDEDDYEIYELIDESIIILNNNLDSVRSRLASHKAFDYFYNNKDLVVKYFQQKYNIQLSGYMSLTFSYQNQYSISYENLFKQEIHMTSDDMNNMCSYIDKMNSIK